MNPEHRLNSKHSLRPKIVRAAHRHVAPKSSRLGIVSALAAFAVVAAGIVFVPSTASAAPGPNPSVNISVTKIFDGTGFGTSSATFVNGANGFVPGDNSATDSVVSSGDIVGYDVSLKIKAGVARTVAVSMSTTEMLEWRDGKSTFCAPAPGITATISGNTCLFSVALGATASVTRSVTMTALDTAGLAIADQMLSVSVGLEGSPTYATVNAATVTVVSAPAADLVIIPKDGKNNLAYTTSAGRGYFDLNVLPLAYPGYSPVKGASTLAQWSATVDVSAFPAGTTWTLGSPAVAVPVIGNTLVVSGTGSQRLSFVMPGNVWPTQDEGSTEFYDIGITVPKTAFSTPDYLNNGNGTQPGTGISRSTTTFNVNHGATAGTPYPNNDYSRFQVFRPVTPIGDLFGKSMLVPRNPNQSIFESGNMTFADSLVTAGSWDGNPAKVAAGTEMLAQPFVVLSMIEDANPVSITLGDEWNIAEQCSDGPVYLTLPGGAVVDPSLYTVWWSTTATGASVGDASVTTGWVQQTNAPAGAQAVRVTLNPGAVPVGAEAGANGSLILNIPVIVDRDLTALDASVLVDKMWGSVGGHEPVSGINAVTLVSPVTPSLLINHIVTPENALPGSPVVFTVNGISVVNPTTLANGLNVSVEVTLDPCAANPVNTSPGWDMVITPGSAGPSGRTCGDAGAVPAKLIFTPITDPVSWSASTATAKFSDITYSARVSNAAYGALTSSAVLTLADMGEVLPVSDDAMLTVLPQSVSAAVVAAVPPVVEIQSPLKWQVDLTSTLATGSSSTIIALPRNNDGAAYFGGVSNPGSYPSATSSDFTGSYTVASASLSPGDTSAGVQLYFTTASNPSIDPSSTVAVWHLVSAAGTGGVPALSGATALKVVSPANIAGTAARVNVTANPTGNLEDDVYLLWAGETKSNTGATAAPMPWPAQVEVIMGSISGTVWWDENHSATMGASEPRIPAVTIGLFKVVGGVVQATPIETAQTNGQGFYKFDGLVHGDYVTRVVSRGANLPASAVSYYQQDIDTEQTYSSVNQAYERASLTSSVNVLAVGAAITDVDYGFFKALPKVDVDKSAGDVVCDGSVCDVTYNLTVTNLGNTPISSGSITDTASSGLYNVEAMFGEFIPKPEIDRVFPRNGASGANVGGYVLTKRGEVYSWGMGANGDNGNGGTANNLTAQVVQGLDGVTIVDVIPRVQLGTATGAYALTDDGKVYAWGGGASGGNGNGSTDNNLTAQLVQGLEGVNVAEVIQRGETGGFALSADGKVYAWGVGLSGGNGNGGGADNLTAQLVQGLDGKTVKSVVYRPGASGNNGGGYAVTTDGLVYVWGHGSNGTSGLGEMVDDVYVATQIPGITNAKELMIRGTYNPSVLTNDGKVYSWGFGNSGQNGDNTTSNRDTPVLVQGLAGITVVKVFTRSNGSYAIGSNGRVYSWGVGASGQNGNGTASNNNNIAAPVLGIPVGVSIKDIAVRGSGAYALSTTGVVYSWGFGNNGSNGNGGNGVNNSAAIVQGLGGVVVTDIFAVGPGVGYAHTSTGAVYSWGQGTNNNALGSGGTANQTTAQPIAGLIAKDLYQRAASGGLALKNDGTLVSWGYAAAGSGGHGNGGAAGALLSPEQVLGFDSRFVLGDSAIPAVSIVPNGAFMERTYPVTSIPVGGKLNIVIVGKVNQAAAQSVISNQAWFTSSTTPIAGILPVGQIKPPLPVSPSVGSLNPEGITGNAQCDTTISGQNDITPDSCDQVPVLIPAATVIPGSLSGNVWVDANRDGYRNGASVEPRVGGVKVYLYAGTELRGETFTDVNGNYLFPDLVPGSDYQVTFEVRGTTPTPEIIAALGLPTGTAYSYGITLRNAGCVGNRSCADPTTAQSYLATVVSGANTPNVNAGLIVAAAGIEVVKTSIAGEPASLQVDASGNTALTPVTISWTNTGTDALTNLVGTDVTTAGPDLVDLVCLYAGVPVTTETVLPPGETVNCTATLPSMRVADIRHTDEFTVTGVGVITNVPVTDTDPWEAVPLGLPKWTMSKSSDPVSGTLISAGSDVIYTLIATNTGDLSLSDLTATDDMSEVLAHAVVSGVLPTELELDNTTLTWAIPEIAPGQSAQVSYTITVNEDAWGVEFQNSVYGAGIVPPDACTTEVPCTTDHRTWIWSGPIPLPNLGGFGVSLYLGLGVVIILGALLLMGTTRRKTESAVSDGKADSNV